MPRRRKPATFQPIDPLILQRYAICMTAIQQGYRFRLMGDLRGKTVLDRGCGDGWQSLETYCV